MDQPTPKFEATPAGPELGTEAAEQAPVFERPKAPAAVTPAAPTPSFPAKTRKVPAAPAKDQETREVEAILEEGVVEAYRSMPPAEAAKFKKEGEHVTHEIVGMLKHLHVKASKVVSLIVGWLKRIPGVNKFFLMQEAKIKTDQIMELAEEEKRRHSTGA